MAACAEHYYAHASFGRDFTTAPELTQVFGELIGLWCADLWDRAGRPDIRLVELGPGRGTLMADASRAAARAGFAPPIHLVETSRTLRAEQAARLPGARWHDTLADVPHDLPFLLVANEFLDALPVRQLVRAPDGWRERCVGWDGEHFRAVAGARVHDALAPSEAPEGAIAEHAPATHALVGEIAARLAARGGAALFVDYGAAGPWRGSTLQAMRDGAPTDPFADPGEVDITAHVDFAAVAAAARGCAVHGPIKQRAFLEALGLYPRTEALARARPDRAEALRGAARRLTDPSEMGTLFKAIALTAPGWPVPAGFA